ncbi:lanthionine synthetase LanC family protein [Thalassomonas sp. RHCl1]|uniref:lanthionine synthetase LanC family protein n=1 Tax=Thalassomonas sp. RHCl1 TaxID=2995320 RepID=UPI00248CC263|nr:lanthionine synthetase LanC family protein [Thalassomonas sp. RHCl1]
MKWQKIVKDEQQAKCKLALESILQELTAKPLAEKDLSLFGGIGGEVVFLWQLGCAYPEMPAQDAVDERLDAIQTNLAQIGHQPAFSSGLSGIGWLFEFLLQQDDYNGEINEELEQLLKQHLSENWQGEYEFISGLLGYITFIQRRARGTRDISLLRQALQLLLQYSTATADGHAWETSVDSVYSFNKQAPEFNLGLAHGVPGVIAVLTCVCQHYPALRAEFEPVLASCCQWLMSQTREEKEPGSRYAYSACTNGHTRLGWCYGDLSNALILGRAGKLLADDVLFQFSRQLMLATSKRLDDDSGVFDAGICHGSAGICLMYQQAGELFDAPELFITAQYWLDHTLARFERDGLNGFDKYSVADECYLPESGLLEGYTGIGLCLLSALGHSSDWSECLLLQ